VRASHQESHTGGQRRQIALLGISSPETGLPLPARLRT
jgi:hypothetical protein